MKKKLLFNSRVNIGTIGLIKTFSNKINFTEKPKTLKNFFSKINFKDYIVMTHRSLITKPIISIEKYNTKIIPIKLEYLLKSSTSVVLKFNLDKTKYEFDKLLMDNLDDLYDRIIKLYAITKKQLINKYGIKYMKDTYFLNENLFVTILSNIEAFNFKSYSEITDKLIITEIVKYFRSIN